MPADTMDPVVQKQPEVKELSLSDVEKMSIQDRNAHLDGGKLDNFVFSKDPEVKKKFHETFTRKPVESDVVVPPEPEKKEPEAVKPEVKAEPEVKDEWQGYGSKEEMLKAFDETRRLAQKYKKTAEQQYELVKHLKRKNKRHKTRFYGFVK